MGMKEEGRRRQAQFKNGKFTDVVEFGALKEEFMLTLKDRIQRETSRV